MEVSQIAGLDTHAIIGGGKAHAFTMSESAEFFTVLSDTLYRDKKRAVVREVVCNAYDAHIVSDKRDTPVEITLTDTELVIKDFGPGIPADKIGTIYCRYGGTTKIQDSNQTGGFGLGSKAPFAYSDHFSVTSCNGGFRHVFAISRGGAETDGKPDFRQMVKVPSEETGVTVSIPLKNEKDRAEFEEIIRSVVMQGGMVANLNGELINRFDYENATNSFIIVPRDGMNESHVYCLYGTVLYPVSTTDSDVHKCLTSIGYLIPHQYRLIVMAPANSVGVTPSRESLSYTDKTKDTLIGLMKSAHRTLEQSMRPVAKVIIKECAVAIAASEDRLWNRSINYQDYRGSARYQLEERPTTAVVRLEDMAAKLAALHIDKLVRNKTKAARREFAKLRPDYRRVFRRARDRGIEDFKIESRLHLRIANKLGLHRNIFAFQVDSWAGAAKPKRFDTVGTSSSQVMPKLYVSFNQRDIITAITADRKRTKAKDPDYGCPHSYMAFVLKRSQHGMVAKIKLEAQRYGISVEEVAITPPPKRAKKVPEDARFVSLLDLKPNKKEQGEPALVTAQYYLRQVNDWYHSYGVGPVTNHAKTVTNYFGDVAVACDVKDEAALKARGSVNLYAAMAEFLLANIKKKEVLYAVMMAQGFVTENVGYREPSQLVQSVIHNRSAAEWFFPPKTKLTEVFEKALFCTQRLKERLRGQYQHKKLDQAEYTRISEMLETVINAAQSVYGYLRLERREANRKFAYLSVFAKSFPYANVDDAASLDDFMIVVKALQRKYQAQAKAEAKAAALAAQTPQIKAIPDAEPVPAPAPITINKIAVVEKEAA